MNKILQKLSILSLIWMKLKKWRNRKYDILFIVSLYVKIKNLTSRNKPTKNKKKIFCYN